MNEVTREDLNLVSMQVILHAGNARDLVFQAVKKATIGEFKISEELMKSVDRELVDAHKLQTDTLQKEAEEIEIPYSPLFGHAQDTLMTVMSEINLMKEIIKIYQRLENLENG